MAHHGGAQQYAPDQNCLASQKTWFVLFEFFSQNSQEYAFLPVSVCDGSTSQDPFFNHDEICSRYVYALSTQDTHDPSQKFRIDRTETRTLTVLMEKGQFAVAEVAGKKVKPTLKLTMKEELNPNEFVDRVSEYLTFIGEFIGSARDYIALCTTQKNELLKEFQKATKAKRDEYELMNQGMRMMTKRK